MLQIEFILAAKGCTRFHAGGNNNILSRHEKKVPKCSATTKISLRISQSDQAIRSHLTEPDALEYIHQ